MRLYWRNLLQFEIPATSTPPNILLFTDLITKKRRKIAYHFKLEGRKFDFTRRSNFISGTNGFPVNGEPIFQVNRIGIISTVYPLSFVKCENLLIKRCRRPKVNSRSWNFHLDENIRSANIEVLGIRTRESSSSEYKIFNIFLFIATNIIESNFTGEILFSQKKKKTRSFFIFLLLHFIFLSKKQIKNNQMIDTTLNEYSYTCFFGYIFEVSEQRFTNTVRDP